MPSRKQMEIIVSTDCRFDKRLLVPVVWSQFSEAVVLEESNSNMLVSTWAVTNMIGIFSVLIRLNLLSGTFISPRPEYTLGGMLTGNGHIASDGFYSGAPSGVPEGNGGTFVFPGPNDRRAAFFGLLKLPYIICYHAAYGKWPNFPPQLQAAVLDLGRHVFAMNDYGLRNYCSKYFRVTKVHRPCCATSVIQSTSGHGQVSSGDLPTGNKNPGKRATPAPDAEVIPELEPENEDEAYADEPSTDSEDFDTAERLVRKVQHGSKCQGVSGSCMPKTVSFVPLSNSANGKQHEKDVFEKKKPSTNVDGKVGSTGIPK
ncbi:uncharacterized protein LOC134214479 isoform X2 [Armigeres subalbatus]|uniref:uncharacterized protein LOC134214479 isoform X2 n=1 Tax=Armigeres subalbatus TaxID=124917 RepID=UPI002ED07829